MTLDKTGQAQLDVFCHCYAKLLDHLDALDDVAQTHRGWSGYRVIRECVDPATEKFGSFPPESPDLLSRCEGFLGRIAGFIDGNLPGGSPVSEVISACKTAAIGRDVLSPTDLVPWQQLGEDLSRQCYQTVLLEGHPNLARAVRPVSIKAANKQGFLAVPQKEGGESEIIFYFAAPEFTLASYTNLPFYFFHEYLSHLHTAALFGEAQETPKPFEEGWLLYLEEQEYSRLVLQDPPAGLSHPLHRDYFAHKYVGETVAGSGRPLVGHGYRQARRFHGFVGSRLLREVTLLVAIHPYNHLSPDIPDLHGEFVRRVGTWLQRQATLLKEVKQDQIRRLAHILEQDDAVRLLLAFLIES